MKAKHVFNERLTPQSSEAAFFFFLHSSPNLSALYVKGLDKVEFPW